MSEADDQLIPSPPQHRAVAFVQDAGHFLRAAEIVDGQTRSLLGLAPDMLAPVYFLLGHSMELLLKAFLLAHGMTEADLSKRRLGHNLSALQAEANQHEFQASAAFSTMVGCLAAHHGAFAFRYRKTGRMLLPDVPHVCAAIRPMIAEVDGVVRLKLSAL